ncbi:hypothetical protein V6Z11_A12G000500 [Gossypium hirsutum]
MSGFTFLYLHFRFFFISLIFHFDFNTNLLSKSRYKTRKEKERGTSPESFAVASPEVSPLSSGLKRGGDPFSSFPSDSKKARPSSSSWNKAERLISVYHQPPNTVVARWSHD